MSKLHYFLCLIFVGSTAFAQNMAPPLLKKASNFYEKYKANKNDIEKFFQNDELARLPKDDIDFLKSRIKVYGLTPFIIQGNSILLTLGPDKNLEIDYQSIDLSTLIIQGVPYTFNLNQPLKKLYEVDYKKALRKLQKENSSVWHYPFFTLALSGCVNSGKPLESATNSSSIPLAYLRACAECASIATNPTGALVGTGMAVMKGAFVGIKNKSWNSCGMEICQNLPGIGAFMDIYHATKNQNLNNSEHSK